MVYNEQMVADRIAELRRQKCLSQEELAARMHISVTTLWRFESGRQQIMLERAVKMANILGCTVNDMVQDFLEYPFPITPIGLLLCCRLVMTQSRIFYMKLWGLC